jgi:hypothetical protein
MNSEKFMNLKLVKTRLNAFGEDGKVALPKFKTANLTMI